MSKEKNNAISLEQLDKVNGGYLEDMDVLDSSGWNVQCPYCYYNGQDIRSASTLKSVYGATEYTCSKCKNTFYVTSEGSIYTKEEYRQILLSQGKDIPKN